MSDPYFRGWSAEARHEYFEARHRSFLEDIRLRLRPRWRNRLRRTRLCHKRPPWQDAQVRDRLNFLTGKPFQAIKWRMHKGKRCLP